MIELIRDMLALLAVVLITAGVWRIYPPASLIVLGALVLVGLLLGTRRPKRVDGIEETDDE